MSTSAPLLLYICFPICCPYADVNHVYSPSHLPGCNAALCRICCLSAVILLCILLSTFYHVVDLHKLLMLDFSSLFERFRLPLLRSSPYLKWFRVLSCHCREIKFDRVPIVSTYYRTSATRMPPLTDDHISFAFIVFAHRKTSNRTPVYQDKLPRLPNTVS